MYNDDTTELGAQYRRQSLKCLDRALKMVCNKCCDTKSASSKQMAFGIFRIEHVYIINAFRSHWGLFQGS